MLPYPQIVTDLFIYFLIAVIIICLYYFYIMNRLLLSLHSKLDVSVMQGIAWNK